MGWRHVKDGQPIDLHVDEGERVFRALAYWSHDFDGPGMELHVCARESESARERVIEKLGDLVVGVHHPATVALFELDDELAALTRWHGRFLGAVTPLPCP